VVEVVVVVVVMMAVVALMGDKQTRKRVRARCKASEGQQHEMRLPTHRASADRRKQIKKTQDELQWIVAQRLLSALTIPGFR
jgi:Flp pilus assembly protein TadB